MAELRCMAGYTEAEHWHDGAYWCPAEPGKVYVKFAKAEPPPTPEEEETFPPDPLTDWPATVIEAEPPDTFGMEPQEAWAVEEAWLAEQRGTVRPQ